MKSYLLITGATGLLGRYLLRDLLAAEPANHLAVVVRASERETSAERIEAILRFWDQRLGRCLVRPVLLEGDISVPDLGLAADDIRWVAQHCGAMLHNAASLTFVAPDGRAGEPWKSNLDGTQHALDLCRRTGIREFFHVSTAYTCGLRTGRVYESELDVGQEFGNDYERSKLAAEQAVRGASYLDRVTVFRPSIIVGDSETGYTSTFHGFYAPLQLAHALLRFIHGGGTADLRFLERLNLAGTETKNFVPVDWVSEVMAHVIRNSDLHGQTYHLTSPEPITVEFMQEIILAAIQPLLSQQIRGPSVAGQPRPQVVDLEQLFRERLMIYESYWRDDPRFDSANTQRAAPHLACPKLDRTTLGRMCRFALDTQFGWPRPPRVAIEFDVARWLAQRFPEPCDAQVADESRVALKVTGSGGGAWTLQFHNDRVVGWERALVACPAATIVLTSTSFRQLVAHQVDVEQLVASGRMSISGDKTDGRTYVRRLASLFPKSEGPPFVSLIPATEIVAATPRNPVS